MTRRFRSAAEAEAHLLSFINYETRSRYTRDTRTHDLRRFREVLAAAGWRPDAVSTVHLGGTNGKGSTAHLLEALFRAAGLRTGLYTSPHLEDVRERIRIDGKPIGPAAFRDGVERLADRFAREPGAGFRTFFEHLTALAFLAFQEARVDVAVIEVGLGGKLDATNVLPPGDAVITPVSLDHQHVLGNTVGRIAADKAHILKRGGRAWLAPQVPAARRALLGRCRREGIPWTDTGESVTVVPGVRGPYGTRFRVRTPGGIDREVATGLYGAFQGANLATAIAVVEARLGSRRTERALATGLRGIRIPGRLERIAAGGRVWLLDGGHNPAAAEAVVGALDTHFPGRPVTGVVGLAGDKAVGEVLGILARHVERFILTRSGNPRAARPADLRAALAGRRPAFVAGDVPAALERARGLTGDGDVILVAGSFVVAGEARRALRELR